MCNTKMSFHGAVVMDTDVRLKSFKNLLGTLYECFLFTERQLQTEKYSEEVCSNLSKSCKTPKRTLDSN